MTKLDALLAALAPLGVVSVDANHVVAPASLQAAAQPTIDAFDFSDAAQAARENTQARTDAAAVISTDVTATGKSLRAVGAVAVDEVNALREWIVSFKAAVAAATTLANLKTGVAALPDLPDRTLAQLKTAIVSKIAAGTVD